MGINADRDYLTNVKNLYMNVETLFVLFMQDKMIYGA